MAASVEPRQFGGLEPDTAPARTTSSGIRRRADSPVRGGCSFPALISPPRKAVPVREDASDNDEEDEQVD